MAFPILYAKQTIYPSLISLTNTLHFEHEDSSGTICYKSVFNELIKDLYPDYPGGLNFDKINQFYRLWDPSDAEEFQANLNTFLNNNWHNFRYTMINYFIGCGNPATALRDQFNKKKIRMKLLFNCFNTVISFRSAFDSICGLSKDLRDFALQDDSLGLQPVSNDSKEFPPILNGWMEGLVLSFMGNLTEQFIQATDTAQSLMNDLITANVSFNEKNVTNILANLYKEERRIIQRQLNDILMESAKISFDWTINQKQSVMLQGEVSLDADTINIETISPLPQSKQFQSVYSNKVNEPVQDIIAYNDIFINGYTSDTNPDHNLDSIKWYSSDNKAPTTPYDS